MEFAMLKNKDNRYIKSLIINGTNVLLRLSITYKKGVLGSPLILYKRSAIQCIC